MPDLCNFLQNVGSNIHGLVLMKDGLNLRCESTIIFVMSLALPMDDCWYAYCFKIRATKFISHLAGVCDY